MQNHFTQKMNNVKTALNFVIIALVLSTTTQSSANDTTARIGAGGIILLKNESIRMLEEALEISTNKITVRYRFLNESDHDIRTTVAFPLPDYEYDPDTVELMKLRAYRKFSSFRNWVNGKPVSVKHIQKALIGTTDVTDKLRSIGLTDKQIFETFGESGANGAVLTTNQRKRIAALFSNIPSGNKEYSSWKVSETIYWEQTFPKGKEIEALHEYIPNRGNATNYINRIDQKEFLHPVPRAFSLSKESGRDPKEACVDKGTIQTVQRRIKNILSKSPDSQVGVHLFDVEYILGTGRNWNGPIGNFVLRIKKESPDQLVSLCFPGKSKKINPTTIEYIHKDYIPQNRLVIYFVTIIQN
jgi:hypothetical protein